MGKKTLILIMFIAGYILIFNSVQVYGVTEEIYATGNFFGYTDSSFPYGVPSYTIIDRRTKIGPPIIIPNSGGQDL